MTEKVAAALRFLKDGAYKMNRRDEVLCEELAEDASLEAHGRRLRTMLEAEKPNLFPNDAFGFNRTLKDAPWKSGWRIPNNVTPDYPFVLAHGLDGILAEDDRHEENAMYAAIRTDMAALYALCERYRAAAQAQGCTCLAEALQQVPRKAPRNFYEACLMLKIVIFAIRLGLNHHITLGRFDQYMLPFWEADLARGISRETLLETLELFFISLNFDTDLYKGVQQGDNGQSLMLGGYDPDGTDRYNGLSEAVLKTSMELRIIDPKINLRVNKTTPLSRLEYASGLTKLGLGFPQYSNDDIVVPGLIRLGYAPEDAYDYTVAACWEFIIPGKGMDIVNVTNINLPGVLVQTLEKELPDCPDYESFERAYFRDIRREYDRLIENKRDYHLTGAPFLSAFIRGCLESGKDVSEGGAVYNNFGVLSAGISTAVDSLAAVKKAVFEERFVTPDALLAALKADFEGFDTLRNYLLRCPKMGNNDDAADSIAVRMLSAMDESINGRDNYHGGVWRGSTGSAQGYIVFSRKTPATPDGRKAYTPYASSFTPAPGVRTAGPLSVLQSFTKFDLRRLCNGGPLTMELSDTLFRNEEGVKKTAAFVKLFIDLGGQQLQLNTLDRERLLDAKAHPERHKDLVVRVWGWSGYFHELSPEYQDHILARTAYLM